MKATSAIGSDVSRGDWGPGEQLDQIIDRARIDTREKQFCTDIGNYLQSYARERPEIAALWCFGIGFVLGWRLKPW